MEEKLKLLATRLHGCPEKVAPVDQRLVRSLWGSMRTIDLENGDSVTAAVIIGIILFDQEMMHPLLTSEELTQLETIAKNALERYHQSINPPKPVGQALAAALKGIKE